MSKAKRELRRRLQREQRAIDARLADAVAPNPTRPGRCWAERTSAMSYRIGPREPLMAGWA